MAIIGVAATGIMAWHQREMKKWRVSHVRHVKRHGKMAYGVWHRGNIMLMAYRNVKIWQSIDIGEK